MKAWLCRILKVPPEPALPPGSRESVKVFHAAQNFFYVLLLQWGVKQVSAIIGIIFSLTVLHNISQQWSDTARFWANAAEYLGIVVYLVQVPFTLLMVRLNYELRWYIVTDRSLRIRSGLVYVREMTMTFANIQHLAVHQGPLQRLLGIYDLKVRTAGGGGQESDGHQQTPKSSVAHLGYFHGVDNAPAIRDLIIQRMKQVRDAGLGDTDDSPAHAAAKPTPTTGLESFRSAVTDLRAEIATLQQTLRASSSTKEPARDSSGSLKNTLADRSA